MRGQVGGQVKKGWIYATLVMIGLWVLVSLWHAAKAFKYHSTSIVDFLPMPIFIGFMLFLIKKTNNRRTVQNVTCGTASISCKDALNGCTFPNAGQSSGYSGVQAIERQVHEARPSLPFCI